MKNNELTEVKAAMPSLEGLPQEVIEYVHGLVAENAALKKFIVEECVIPHEFYGDNKDAADFMPETPATDAAIAELRAQGVDEFGIYHNFNDKQNIAAEAKKFAANLRAGRKCIIPPAGWSCTRAAGHDGPCAAVEDASHE